MRKILLSTILLAGAFTLLFAATITEKFTLHKGWNLLSSSYEINFFADKNFRNPDIKVIFFNDYGKWYYYSSNIELKDYPKKYNIPAGKGFWIYSKKDMVLTREKDVYDNNGTVNENFILNKGWNLVGSTYRIDLENKSLFNNPNTPVIFTYDNNKWFYYSNKVKVNLPRIKSISPNRGFWVYSTKHINLTRQIKLNDNNITALNNESNESYVNSQIETDEVVSNLTAAQKVELAILFEKMFVEYNLYRNYSIRLIKNYDDGRVIGLGVYLGKAENDKYKQLKIMLEIFKKYNFSPLGIHLTDKDNYDLPYDEKAMQDFIEDKGRTHYIEAFHDKQRTLLKKPIIPVHYANISCFMERETSNDTNALINDLKDQPFIVKKLKEILEIEKKIKREIYEGYKSLGKTDFYKSLCLNGEDRKYLDIGNKDVVSEK